MAPKLRRQPEGVEAIIDIAKQALRGEADSYIQAFKGQMGGWLKDFAFHAAPKVKRALGQGVRCQAKNYTAGVWSDCEQKAAVSCAVCARDTCLHHAFVSVLGDAICWHCVQASVQAKAGAPRGQPPRDRAPGAQGPDQDKERALAALRELGLEPSATWEQVQKAFRQFAARNHPDGVSDPAERQAAERRFKRISEAYNFLKQIGWGQRPPA